MKLRGKFTIMFVAFALLPVFIGGTATYFETKSANINQAYDTLQGQGKAAKTSLEGIEGTIESVGKQVAKESVLIDYVNGVNSGTLDEHAKADIKTELKNMIKDFQYQTNISVMDKNGKCIVDATGNLDGQDLSKMDYFIEANKTKVTYVAKVKLSIVSGKPMFAVSEPIIDKNNEVIGVLMQAVDLDLLSKKYVNNIKIGKTGFVYIVQADGSAIAHPNKNEIFKKNILKTSAGSKILKEKNGITEDTYNGEQRLTAYSYNSKLGWIFIANIPMKELMTTSDKVLSATIYLMLITVIISIAVAGFIAKSVSKPILTISKSMDKIASGDFTLKVSAKGKDETAYMANRLNQTIGSVRNSILDVKSTSNKIEDSTGTLSATSEEMVASVNEVSKAIQEVADGATSQAQELMDVVNLISAFTKDLDEANSKLSLVDEETKVAERKVVDGKGEIDILIKTINEVKEAFNNVMNKINGLEESVSKIGSITEVINDISEQTNLLALNAAIEAARAGEHGKGFAVVAEEVRMLAEEAKNSSGEISNLIKSIDSETKNVIDTSNNVRSVLDNQNEAANNTIKLLYSINDAVGGIIPLMAKATGSIDNVMKAKDTVLNKVQNVSAVSEEVSASSEEIAASSQQMLASAEQVTNEAQKINEVAEDLVRKVDKFTV